MEKSCFLLEKKKLIIGIGGWREESNKIINILTLKIQISGFFKFIKYDKRNQFVIILY